MLNPDVRARLAAIVMLLLSLSIIVLYISVEAGARPVKAIAPVSVQANSADTIPSSRADGIPLVTAALKKNDFTSARNLADRLLRPPMHDQILHVIDSAAMRWTIEQVASDIRGRQYGEARLRAGIVQEESARLELLEIIDFAEARTAIGAHDIETASTLAAGLQPGLKRAILFTALAAHEPSRNQMASLDYADRALNDLPWINVRHRRQLLTMIARVLLEVDSEDGLAVLDRALHEGAPGQRAGASFLQKSGGAGAASIGIAGDGFVEVISAGGAGQAFSLVVPGVTANLAQLLIEQHGRVRCTDPKHAIRLISGRKRAL